MKRLIVAAGLVLMLTSCNQTKIGYVKIDKVLKEYGGSKDIEKSMKEKSDKIMGELEPMAREFQAKVQEFQKNSAKLSTKAKAEQQQQLMQEQQVLQQRQQMAQQSVQQEGQQMYIDMDKKVDSLIGVYAKANGYIFVLGTSPQTKAVIYGKDATNITDQVIESLNKSYGSDDTTPAVEEKAEEKSEN